MRGRGLMIGLKCKVSNKDFQKILAKNNLLTVTAGDNVIRLLPPLIINKDQIDEAVKIINNTAIFFENSKFIK